jgi:hypothetical protein
MDGLASTSLRKTRVNRVGLPSYQFIQDELEYFRTPDVFP